MADHLTAGVIAYAILSTAYGAWVTAAYVRTFERAQSLVAKLRAHTRAEMGER